MTPEIARASTIPSHWYTRPDLLAVEPLAIVRGADGVLRAFSNVCRHRASMLLGTPEFEGVEDWDKSTANRVVVPWRL
jgi:hypothetical protein